MQKKLNIPFVSELANASVESAGKLLKKTCAVHRIDSINWRKKFPYQPETYFYIACTPDALWIHFYVLEEKVRAVRTEDMSEVWNDSCVEFFVKTPDEAIYRNFEFNCIGYCMATIRKSKTDYIMLSNDELQGIARFASLGRQALDYAEPADWELTVKIPAALLGVPELKQGNILLGNFYKCGDETDTPHYVSWNKIAAEEPNFHIPACFGVLEFT